MSNKQCDGTKYDKSINKFVLCKNDGCYFILHKNFKYIDAYCEYCMNNIINVFNYYYADQNIYKVMNQKEYETWKKTKILQ